jgi:hypothetical protein
MHDIKSACKEHTRLIIMLVRDLLKKNTGYRSIRVERGKSRYARKSDFLKRLLPHYAIEHHLRVHMMDGYQKHTSDT